MFCNDSRDQLSYLSWILVMVRSQLWAENQLGEKHNHASWECEEFR